MVIPRPLQPDQDAARWDAHVAGYEAVFERLTDAFAARALDGLEPLAGAALLDLAAGAGGAALQAAARGARVTALDASPAMVARIRERAALAGIDAIAAECADGAAKLPVPDAAFDAALSCFGVVLFPDPAPALAELARVLRPGGRLAVVTWTEPERYELAVRLREAVIAVRGAPPPMAELPAQLRYTEPAALAALAEAGGFGAVRIERVEAALAAPSARALAGSLDFAPGMAAMLAGLGPDRARVLDAFAARLEADQGTGPVALAAVAHIAFAARR
jgi:ubiquinone/menaquinone biosynthesis C-methylase UbiE